MTTVSSVTRGRSAWTNVQWPIMFFSSLSQTWTTLRDPVSASLNTYVPGCNVTPGISTDVLNVRNDRSFVSNCCAVALPARAARTASTSAVAISFTRFIASPSSLVSIWLGPVGRQRHVIKLHLVCLAAAEVSGKHQLMLGGIRERGADPSVFPYPTSRPDR